MIACEFRIYFVHFSTLTNEKILTTLTGVVLCYPWWKHTQMHINSVAKRYSLLLTNDRSIFRTLVNNYNNCKYLISRGLHNWILAYYTRAHAQYTTQWSTGVTGLYSGAKSQYWQIHQGRTSILQVWGCYISQGDSVSTESPAWTTPIGKTWTAVWHLLPQLLPGTHWCYS